MIHISLILLFGVFLSILSKNYNIPILDWLLLKFERKDEKIPGKGAICFFLGIFFLLIIFGNSDITLASIMVLTFGDSFSSLVGKSLQRAKHIKKTKHLLSNEKLIEAVCDIVGHHHHPREDDTINFKVLYDADLIVNLEEKQKEKPMDQDRLADIIEKSFLTESGRKKAKEILVNTAKAD